MRHDPLIPSPSGGLDFGYLPEDAARIIRRQAGPIRLLVSDLRHIEERHGNQIRQAGYESVEGFVETVVTEYNRIYATKGGSLGLLVHHNGRERFAMIRLQPAIDDGNGQDFYAVKTASLCRDGYLMNRKPLLEQDGPILSSRKNPFNPGTKVVDQTLADVLENVNSLAPPNLHPPPDVLNRNEFLVETTSRGGHVMAAQLDHLLSYGPLDVVASNEEKNPGLHIVNVDAESRAFISQDDPLHKEIRNIVEKNPHSLGFAANQINARLEQEGRWLGPERDAEGLNFSPSLSKEAEAPGKIPPFEMETFQAQKVDLPDGMKTALNPRVELRPLVIREGSRIAPKNMEPGDHLKGYVVQGHTDPLPGADEMEHNLFPGKGQQVFSAEELDKARDTAQAMAADTAIDFAALETGYKERTGREFGSGRYFQRGHMESGMDRWQEQKARHLARETPAVGPAEPEMPEVADVGKLGNDAVVQETPALKPVLM